MKNKRTLMKKLLHRQVNEWMDRRAYDEIFVPSLEQLLPDNLSILSSGERKC